ncbi:hypothetical protein J3Q64DRAFT_1640160 [Phycomyces blakesleeanus]|uniref:Phospholipid/glycerol acyltransferase domain-containing protein n=1 Tax=Phycomyces blakesleeanus TaxID=4837 RepID=A0ABR3B0J9_PHYBL
MTGQLCIDAITQGIVKVGFRVILHVFFREIKTSGVDQVPANGPCIFIVGPHSNQFVDGMVFYSYTVRRTYSVMAAVSYKKPVIGHIGQVLRAIPVVRPQDIMKSGTGHVLYDPMDPYRVRGVGTMFTQELMPRDTVVFVGCKLQVIKVVSDTEMEIAYTLDTREDALAGCKSNVPCVFKIAPHVDQTPVYEEVHNYLDNNQCIVIFPEGGSHDRTEMLPLKAGFAVMALGAVAENPSLDLKIIPVGLNYFHPDQFRSRAVVSYGQPISVSHEDAEMFKRGGRDKHEAVMRLLDQSDEAFKGVTISAPDDDTLCIIRAACRLRESDHHTPLSIEQIVQHNRDFAKGWNQLRSDPQLQALSRRVKLYNETLSFFDIKDHQVEKLNIPQMTAARLLVQRLTKLLVVSGVCAPAYIANLPLMWITQYISKMKQREALAGSMVKVAAKDVLATWKVLVAAFAVPSLYLLYAGIYVFYFAKNRIFLSPKAKILKISNLFALQLILQYGFLRLGDAGRDLYKSTKPLFLALRNPKAGEILQSMRSNLAKDITTFVSQHTNIFPTFDENIENINESPITRGKKGRKIRRRNYILT